MKNSCPGQPPLMTIFYSGKVNVYQNVPADKAHAIMLLLSNDKSESGKVCAGSLLMNALSLSNPISANPNPNNGAPSSNLPPRPPFSPSALQVIHKKLPGPAPIKRSQAELPFARKASLTRFLSKRKDRVEARLCKESSADGGAGTGEEEDGVSEQGSRPTKKFKL